MKFGKFNLFFVIGIFIFSMFYVQSVAAEIIEGAAIETGMENLDVNLYEGDFSFSIPVGSLAGRAGQSYSISLNYNGNVYNAMHKSNEKIQAGIVGLGFSLDPGYIYRTPGADILADHDDSLFLSVPGVASSELVETSFDNGLYNYKLKQDSFVKVEGNEASGYIATTIDGTKYHFTEPLLTHAYEYDPTTAENHDRYRDMGLYSFNDARSLCTTQGGYLALIRSAEEEQRIIEEFSDILSDGLWIGLNDMYNENPSDPDGPPLPPDGCFLDHEWEGPCVVIDEATGEVECGGVSSYRNFDGTDPNFPVNSYCDPEDQANPNIFTAVYMKQNRKWEDVIPSNAGLNHAICEFDLPFPGDRTESNNVYKYRWNIKKIEDVSGNRISFNYLLYSRPVNGYPSEISYLSSINDGVGGSINLEYLDGRQDVYYGRPLIAGDPPSNTVKEKYLDNVKVRYDGNLISKTEFEYDYMKDDSMYPICDGDCENDCWDGIDNNNNGCFDFPAEASCNSMSPLGGHVEETSDAGCNYLNSEPIRIYDKLILKKIRSYGNDGVSKLPPFVFSYYGEPAYPPSYGSIEGYMKEVKYPTGAKVVLDYEPREITHYVTYDSHNGVDSVNNFGGAGPCTNFNNPDSCNVAWYCKWDPSDNPPNYGQCNLENNYFGYRVKEKTASNGMGEIESTNYEYSSNVSLHLEDEGDNYVGHDFVKSILPAGYGSVTTHFCNDQNNCEGLDLSCGTNQNQQGLLDRFGYRTVLEDVLGEVVSETNNFVCPIITFEDGYSKRSHFNELLRTESEIDSVLSTTEYGYNVDLDANDNGLLESKKTFNSDGSWMIEETTWCHENSQCFDHSSMPGSQGLIEENLLAFPYTSKVRDNSGDVLRFQYVHYLDWQEGEGIRIYPWRTSVWEDLDGDNVVEWGENGDFFVSSYINSYDEYGNVLEVIDSNNHFSRIYYGLEGECENSEFSSHELPTCEEKCLDPTCEEVFQSRTYYDEYGRVEKVKDENNVLTKYGYDVFGRLLDVKKPGERESSIEYEYYYATKEGEPSHEGCVGGNLDYFTCDQIATNVIYAWCEIEWNCNNNPSEDCMACVDPYETPYKSIACSEVEGCDWDGLNKICTGEFSGGPETCEAQSARADYGDLPLCEYLVNAAYCQVDQVGGNSPIEISEINPNYVLTRTDLDSDTQSESRIHYDGLSRDVQTQIKRDNVGGVIFQDREYNEISKLKKVVEARSGEEAAGKIIFGGRNSYLKSVENYKEEGKNPYYVYDNPGFLKRGLNSIKEVFNFREGEGGEGGESSYIFYEKDPLARKNKVFPLSTYVEDAEDFDCGVDNICVETSYDSCEGEDYFCQTVTDPKGEFVTNRYDKLGNLVEIINTEEKTINSDFNILGELEKVYDVEGRVSKSRVYNTLGQAKRSWDLDSHLSKYTYDSNGNVRTVLPPNGDTITNSYDSLDRIEIVAVNARWDGGSEPRYEREVLKYQYDFGSEEVVLRDGPTSEENSFTPTVESPTCPPVLPKVFPVWVDPGDGPCNRCATPGSVRMCSTGINTDCGEDCECSSGEQVCRDNGFWSTCASSDDDVQATETCWDGFDNDCSGETDDSCTGHLACNAGMCALLPGEDGNHRDDCSILEESCTSDSCIDETMPGECSESLEYGPPFICDGISGLVPDCSECGCPSGLFCSAEGTCQTEPEDSCGYGKGRLCKITDLLNGNEIRYTYNERGLIVKVIEFTNGQEFSTSYGYDLQGNILSITDGLSEYEIEYEYNLLGQLESLKVNGVEESVDYVYTAEGLIDTINYPNGIFSDYSYGKRNWIEEIFVEGDEVLFNEKYDYDEVGNLIRIENWEPIENSGIEGECVEFFYDSFYRLNRVKDRGTSCNEEQSWTDYYNPSGGLGINLDYIYDDSGNRLNREVSGHTEGPVWTQDYIYGYEGGQANGEFQNNKLFSTSSEVEGDCNYHYDAAGNLLSKVCVLGNHGGAEKTDYSYDYKNMLTGIIYSNWDSDLQEYILTGKSLSFEYDAIGRRVRKVVVTSEYPNGLETIYSYGLGTNPLFENTQDLGAS
jgi:YD repeat-containing protein